MIGCGALMAMILSGKGLTGRWSRYGFFLDYVFIFGAISIEGK
jgi:hypothetical protein